MRREAAVDILWGIYRNTVPINGLVKRMLAVDVPWEVCPLNRLFLEITLEAALEDIKAVHSIFDDCGGCCCGAWKREIFWGKDDEKLMADIERVKTAFPDIRIGAIKEIINLPARLRGFVQRKKTVLDRCVSGHHLVECPGDSTAKTTKVA